MALLTVLNRSRTSKQVDGDAGEDRALQYLQQQGLKLVERNFRCKGGEIDIIMQDQTTLVFVEVRKRANGKFGGAVASVTPRKQARLIIAAQTFMQRYWTPPPCRFDVVAIEGVSLDWLVNVIDA